MKLEIVLLAISKEMIRFIGNIFTGLSGGHFLEIVGTRSHGHASSDDSGNDFVVSVAWLSRAKSGNYIAFFNAWQQNNIVALVIFSNHISSSSRKRWKYGNRNSFISFQLLYVSLGI